MKYAILPVLDTSHGAPMGRVCFNDFPGIKCRGSILPLRVNEGYDNGGAYWGTPNNVWRATYSTKKNTDFYIMGEVYVRASSREEAIETVHKIRGWENVTFIGG